MCEADNFVKGMTGLATYYSNNSQAGNRGTVRRNRNYNTITKDGIKYTNEDIFVAHFGGRLSLKQVLHFN